MSLRVALWVVLGLSLILLMITLAYAQQVRCHYVGNGSNITIACANGYWQTITPDGEVYTGNGVPDPNAGAAGSTIAINPATGGPSVGAGPTVAPPTQQLPMLAPHQAEQFGFQPRLE